MLKRSSRLPNLPLDQRITISGGRLERHLRALCMQTDAHGIATGAFHGIDMSFEMQNAGVQWLGNLFGVRLQLPFHRTLRAAVFNLEPPEIWVILEPMTIAHLSPMERMNSDKILHANLGAIAGLHLLAYYEEFIHQVAAAASSRRAKLDPVWAFARVVRNAFVHGRLNISDPNFQTVTWHGKSYGLQDNGKSIVPEELRFSDLIILMLEMDASLERIQQSRASDPVQGAD